MKTYFYKSTFPNKIIYCISCDVNIRYGKINCYVIIELHMEPLNVINKNAIRRF